jgi:hypothetical protein
MSDAEISIINDTTKQTLRLIIVSHNGCYIVSHERASFCSVDVALLIQAVADDFISSLQTPGRRRNFASPTYLVQIEGSGAREVHHFRRGFEYLDFSSVQSKSIVVMWRMY